MASSESNSDEESSDEENENCGFEAFKKYKKNMQPLSEPTIKNIDEKRTYTYIDDDVKYGKKKFVVVSSGNQHAYVESIKENGKDLVFANERNMACSGDFQEIFIGIEEVHMGDAAGKGNCTKAVAYLIKTLMIEAETRENWFPHKGTVHLQSYEACAAAHCYFKAFMLNGYDYSEYELDNFIDEIKGSYGDYRFEEFTNEEQERKANAYKERKRKIEESVVACQKRQRTNKNEECFTELKF